MNSTIKKYEELLTQKPNSQIFAALADAYRKIQLTDKALEIASQGVKNHPHFAAGHVVLGRILWDRGQIEKAQICFENTLELENSHILALQLLAQCHLKLKDPKKALKYFKKVLLDHPHHKKSAMAVKRLEGLTADEFKDEDFSMISIGRTRLKSYTSSEEEPKRFKILDRYLSLADAYIARDDSDKALQYLQAAKKEYGSHSDIEKRMRNIKFDPFEEKELEVSKINLSPNLSTNSTSQTIKPLRSITANPTFSEKINYLKSLKKQIAHRKKSISK